MPRRPERPASGWRSSWPDGLARVWGLRRRWRRPRVSPSRGCMPSARRARAGSSRTSGRTLRRGSSRRVTAGFAALAGVSRAPRVTGGNPWLIGELVEELRAAGSCPGSVVDGAFERLVGVQDGVRGRLMGLGDPAVRLAQAIAVLGDGCELPRAGRLAELMPAEAAQAVTALVGGGHLVDRQRLAFVHPLVRAAVRDSMPVAVRAAAHSRAAALLRIEGADGELIAGQLLASSPVRASWAAGVLLEPRNPRSPVGRRRPRSATCAERWKSCPPASRVPRCTLWVMPWRASPTRRRPGCSNVRCVRRRIRGSGLGSRMRPSTR